MTKIHLWQEPISIESGQAVVQVRIEEPNKEPARLWYRLPEEFASVLTRSCDPFVMATIMWAMSKSSDLVIHGEVSPSLLLNLVEFQLAWSQWLPDVYTQIEVQVENEIEQRPPATSAVVSTFSGRVDSCFTAWYHSGRARGRHQRILKVGVLASGFPGNPRGDSETLTIAIRKTKAMLDSLGMDLIPIDTNLSLFSNDWVHNHGPGAISCLALLAGGYRAGLIASSYSYAELGFPIGSNPVTDPLLSSAAFSIIHDGMGYNRVEKIRELAQWPEAMQHLRICFYSDDQDRNCCKCEKCIRTILCFRALGLDLPPCFERDIADVQILRTVFPNPLMIREYKSILSTAKQAGISSSWMRALEVSIRFHELKAIGRKSATMLRLRRRFRKQ